MEREAEQDVRSGSASVSHHGWFQGSGGGFRPTARRVGLGSKEHMGPRCTVTPGIANGEAFNVRGHGMALGVASANLFC